MDTPQEKPTVLDEPSSKPNKSRGPFKLVIAFLLGAVVYATIAGAYNLINRQVEEDANTFVAQPQAPRINNDEAEYVNKTVSENDLKVYVDPVDCTANAAYARYTSLVSLGQLISIDIYDGITIKSVYTTSTKLWKTLPIILDYQCNVIKISDLEKGDRVNVFYDKSVTESQGSSDVKVIQKANL